jgi:hypothetical protein
MESHYSVCGMLGFMYGMAGGRGGKPLKYHELERWKSIGYERGMRSRKGER